MDPNLFYLDTDRVTEVLLAIVVFSLMLERSLAVVFESKWFVDHVFYKVERRLENGEQVVTRVERRYPVLKETIAVAAAFFVCRHWDFDAYSVLLPVKHATTGFWGHLLTALIVAGGSKGSMKLFSDWLKVKSSAQREVDEFREAHRRKATGNTPQP